VSPHYTQPHICIHTAITRKEIEWIRIDLLHSKQTLFPPLRVIYIQEGKKTRYLSEFFFYLTVTCIGFLYIIYMHEVICVLISIIIIMKIVREIPLLWMIPPTFELEDKKKNTPCNGISAFLFILS